MSDPSSPTMSNGSAEAPKSRMIVLCFDGTSNQYGGDNTNVVKLFAMLRKDCETEQLCYYQAGVGTYENPGIFTPMALWCAKVLDEAIAWYLDEHVMGGYQYLMQNWRSGDKISIFGFSRGAYTARALAGMLTKVGLLPRDNVEQIPFAYSMYTRTDKDGLVQAKGFKQTFCRNVSIEFLGVWDTVASTGIIMSRSLPFTTNNAAIKTFRHALSLDEHRAKFVPTFYHRNAPSAKADAHDPEHTSPGPIPTPKLAAGANAKATKVSASVNGSDNTNRNLDDNGNALGAHDLQSPKGKSIAKNKKLWHMFAKDKSSAVSMDEDGEFLGTQHLDVKEVWFAGCHSDIGGGADANDVTHTLSDISLRWMVKEIIKSQCGVQFDTEAMARLNVPTSLPSTPTQSKLHLDGSAPSTTPAPPISALDASDALQPLHDTLKSTPLWWLLEIIPMPFTWQNAQGLWKKKWKFHLGQGRYVNAEEQLLFHVSVKARMADKTLNYTPKAKYTPGTEVYTD